MISVTQLRAGRTFKHEGKLYQVLEYRHTKMGRGQATIRVRVRDLERDAVVEKTFNSGAKVEPIETQVRSLQYLYRDDKDGYFMETKNFEQFSIPTKIFGDKLGFLREGKEVKILFAEGSPLSFELPNSLVFEVVETAPGVKGDTVSGATKTANLDSGLVVRVPLFVKKSDQVKVDTRTGEYLGRVS